VRMLPRVAGRGARGVDGGRWGRPWPGDAIEELNDRPQALEVEQVLGCGRSRVLGRGEIVGAAQGDGGVSSVREPDDKVGVDPPAQANDLDALAAEGVMRMGDGDESRRREG
jgi:hypothetical protein